MKTSPLRQIMENHKHSHKEEDKFSKIHQVLAELWKITDRNFNFSQ